MAIKRIKPEVCVGCGICAKTCPADVIRMDQEAKKAVVRYPEDCVVCCCCLQDCPTKAIVMTAEAYSTYFTSIG